MFNTWLEIKPKLGCVCLFLPLGSQYCSPPGVIPNTQSEHMVSISTQICVVLHVLFGWSTLLQVNLG